MSVPPPSRSSCLSLSLFFLLLAALNLHAAQSITLSWDPGTDPGIIGYHLYYGTVDKPYTEMLDVRTTTAVVPNLLNSTTYVFAVTAYNGAGAESAYSSAIYYTVGAQPNSPPPPNSSPSLDNISSRIFVRTGDNVMIGGFIIQGETPKKVVLRALGPSLANAGVDEVLDDPILELWNSDGTIVASNDDWDSGDPELISIGLAPADPHESAIIATLPAGAYSAVLRGKNSTTGVGLFDLYDLDRGAGSVANISTRGRVDTGDKVMIGGFILGGTQSTNVIVRAIGPSLTAGGVNDALQDPTLELYDSNGTLLSSNDNWRSDQEAAIAATSIPPSDDREAAIVSTLAPGAYSAVVRGVNDTSGVALFEVYALSH